MENCWSSEVDQILAVGLPLDDIGIRNWGLTRDDALTALAKLAKIGVGVLGGDVYSVNGRVVESNYDNWYCNQHEHELGSAFVERSIAMARNYITNYITTEGTVLFAIVPKI